MTLKDEVKEIPIENIIEKYLPLTKKGPYYEGLCPFHFDTRPSLKVNPDKKLFKCFACGTGGDGISFVKEYLKLSFQDALYRIAEDQGIHNSSETPYHNLSRELELLERVKEIYIDAGYVTPHLKNFLNERKISIETAEDFELGFAPDTNVVVNFLKDKEADFELALSLGLIRKTEDGYHDVFRNRLMFPIHREDGGCVGFSGKTIFPEQQPRYMNSKESDVFHKSELLYGFHLSKNSIQRIKEVIIVEGYMDLIALFEHGIPNAVATMGLALSPINVKRLKRIAGRFIIGFDSDEAGKRARERLYTQLLAEHINSHSISYIPWKDPDEFLRNEINGAHQILNKINNSIPILDEIILGEIFTLLNLPLDYKCEYINTLYRKLAPMGLSLPATERIIRYSKLLGLETDSALIIQNYKNYLENS